MHQTIISTKLTQTRNKFKAPSFNFYTAPKTNSMTSSVFQSTDLINELSSQQNCDTHTQPMMTESDAGMVNLAQCDGKRRIPKLPKRWVAVDKMVELQTRWRSVTAGSRWAAAFCLYQISAQHLAEKSRSHRSTPLRGRKAREQSRTHILESLFETFLQSNPVV
jgi:hypothetical protein